MVVHSVGRFFQSVKPKGMYMVQQDYLNMVLAFFEGFALIISPCILPILPIMLSGSLTGSKKRPYGIICGFIVTFALVTYFSRILVLHTGVDLNLIRYVTYLLLFLFGVVMISTTLSEKFMRMTQRLANTGSSFSRVNDPQGGFFSGVLLGGLVGIIWTPCAGPILAAVILQTVLQKTTIMSFFTILFFGIGAAIPMLFIALLGRKIMTKFQFFKIHAQWFRKILGVIIITSVVYMIYGEGVSDALAQSDNSVSTELTNGVSSYSAPEIAGISAWINSSPLEINQLKGKVVLIDFWTYSCINCLRTLPYLKSWYQKYHDKGLVIIGVHSPEFEFEKNYSNVKNAVEKYGIPYPVALDNQFVTWQNYNNQYWPAHYLIDKKGDVVYRHFGEGEYDVTENNIRYLLGITNRDSIATNERYHNFSMGQTPETYLGTARAENFSSPESVVFNKMATYSFPEVLAKNHWALKGNWTVMRDKIISGEAGATLKIHFYAGKVFMVMGSAALQPIHVQLLLNGEKLVDGKGKDVQGGIVTVKEHRLYEVLAMTGASDGVLQIIPDSAGLEVYTFTFG
jgi:cytochrome c biogenesis protein CcdA/thiol-disulfide isomerase/thioredoxin